MGKILNLENFRNIEQKTVLIKTDSPDDMILEDFTQEEREKLKKKNQEKFNSK